MAATDTTITLPNPYTPMAFIPPESETKVRGLIYAIVGSAAVLLWDVILHLPQDYKLATRYRINASFIIYCIARVATMAYILALVISLTAPIGNCDLIRQLSIFFPFTVPFTTILCAMRVCALYGNNKYVVAFFSMTWLFVFSASIVLPLGTSGIQIGNTKYCLDSRTRLTNVLTSSSIIVHDSLIFIATSWALMRYSYSDANLKNGVRVLVLGRHLPALSKSILRDGQAYYLAVLALNLLFTVLCYMSQPPIYPCAVAVPFIVTLNTMSSHIYRNVRFGFYRDYSITSSMIDRAIQGCNESAPRHNAIVFEHSAPTKLESGDLEVGDPSKAERVNDSSSRNSEGESV